MDLCHPEPAELSSGETEELQRIKWHRKQLLEDIQKLKDEIADVFAQIDCFESAEESRMAQKEKELCTGRKKFNMDPAKGIQYFIEHKLLTPDIQDIARFLYKGEGLNKTAIGTYLGERDPVNLQVLQAFVDCHEFANLNLVQALRQFLWSFRLPGEAQKIDRMMEAFATRYCLCNPGVFQSTDTCYVLSFSIIMLNTSLHNPNVRDRPPFERFVSMNRGINNGSDLPEDQLRNLFDSIKSEPFSIPEDDGNDLTHTFFNPDREGWLLKLGERPTDTRRRMHIHAHAGTHCHTHTHARVGTHRHTHTDTRVSTRRCMHTYARTDTRLTRGSHASWGMELDSLQVSWPPVQPSACPIHPSVLRMKGASGGG
uniref:Cytohesin 4 n=1 Tax=Macaca fascicularis TaxID=9541 RepID=A0A2K5U7R8_MACFA